MAFTYAVKGKIRLCLQADNSMIRWEDFREETVNFCSYTELCIAVSQYLKNTDNLLFHLQCWTVTINYLCQL